MAVAKQPGEGSAPTGAPSPLAAARGLVAAVQGEASLLSGRRERRVALEEAGFTSLKIRIATELKPGSWVELGLGNPFPPATMVAGTVESFEVTEEQAGRTKRKEFLVRIDLHAVDEDYLAAANSLIAVAEESSPPLILFADADPMSRTSLSSALRGAGDLVAAASKADIQRQLQTGVAPDAMALGTRLADADAIALVRALATNGWNVPVVLLSGQYRVDAPRAARELAGIAYRMAEKPVGREQLRADLTELVAQGRAERRGKAVEQAHMLLYSRLRDTHQRLRKAVEGYVDTRVMDRVGPENETTANKSQEVSILFVDIRNSTGLIDKLAPEEAVGIVNKVLTELAEAVETHGGMVDKFLGDGLMGLFGVTGEDPHHPHRALAAARSMVHRIKALNDSADFPGGTQIGVGIGIQTGACILGNVGSQFRKEFTALGAAVNVAARLQTLAGAHEIVLPAALAKRLEDVARFESLGEHPLKGFEKPVEVVRVLD